MTKTTKTYFKHVCFHLKYKTKNFILISQKLAATIEMYVTVDDVAMPDDVMLWMTSQSREDDGRIERHVREKFAHKWCSTVVRRMTSLEKFVDEFVAFLFTEKLLFCKCLWLYNLVSLRKCELNFFLMLVLLNYFSLSFWFDCVL